MFNAAMYADDLILLSISVTDMHRMLDICRQELVWLDMKLNVAKSSAMRIGGRWQLDVPPLKIGEDEVAWVKEMTYLGVVLVAGRIFSVDLHPAKRKFFGSLNAILGKVGDMSAVSVLLHLTFTNCYPALLYGIEACKPSKSQHKSLLCAYNASFYKLFGTFDRGVIAQCQFYSGYLPLTLAIDLKTSKFLFSLKVVPTAPAGILLNFVGGEELDQLQLMYGVHAIMSQAAIKKKFWDKFAKIFKN